MKSYAISLLSLAALAAASPVTNRVVHEKREIIPSGWTMVEKMPAEAKLPVRIGLKQSNLHKIGEHLMDVSGPGSEKYGKHWTAAQVADYFKPSDQSFNTVLEWLSANGIGGDRVKTSFDKGWLVFDASVEEVEELLQTEYNIYEHQGGVPHVACTEYSLPESVSKHVDLITPTVHFDSKVSGPKDEMKRRKRSVSSKSQLYKSTPMRRELDPAAFDTAKDIGKPGAGFLPKLNSEVLRPDASALDSEDLSDCWETITPACLHALYNFTYGTTANPDNSFGVVEYTPQAYLPDDLDLYFEEFFPDLVGSRPIFDSIDGGILQTEVEDFAYNGESDLDLEVAMVLVYPQNVTLYQVGDIVEGASFNNFLDGIDASYCTYDGGDDPTQDGVYPDPYTNYTGAYEGPEDCGTYAPTKVISTSYGYNEIDLSVFYEERQCAEYAKLGLLGVTVLYSSGDYGVASNTDQCVSANGTLNDGTSGKFVPSFPGGCPYVTSVGATQIVPNASVTAPEEACETVIYSGGGFSNVFALPEYQAEAVAAYYASYDPGYTAEQYNNSQVVRGFPDVSANGAWYAIAVEGDFYYVFGTSASSPTFGSIITLINEEMLNAGKSTVGFINPILYSYPEVLNDITLGDNPGCGTSGFSAVPGWDPVTGLGTPNYPKMLELFLSI